MVKINRNHHKRAQSQDYNTSIGMTAHMQARYNIQNGQTAAGGAATAVTEQPNYTDFKLIGQVIYLSSLTNQMKKNAGVKSPEIELESSLLAFAKIFKNHVLTDSRILLLCSHLYQERNGEVEGGYDNVSDVDVESGTSLEMLAQLCN